MPGAAKIERWAVSGCETAGWHGSSIKRRGRFDQEWWVNRVRREFGKTYPEQMLEILGFEVLTAEDGDEGVEVFRRHADEIVLVVLDLTMPRMSGEKTFDEIRRLRADARVLLASGYEKQRATERFEGLAGFIQKPYQMVTLREKVRRAIEGPV